LPDEVANLVNDAALPGWRALERARAVALAIDAAEAVDAQLAALPDGAVDGAFAAGMPRVLDRSLHRSDHLDAIDRAIGR
jgi:hypothetical protein